MTRVRPALLAALLALPWVAGGVVPNRFGPLLQTHQWDFSADTTAQRGGSTATFTRATASSRITAAAYATVADSTAVITQVTDSDNTLPASGAPSGVHIGEATTFELLQNNQLSNAAWASTGTPTVTNNAAADPFGVTLADRVADDDGGSAEARTQAVTIAQDAGVWQASGWVSCTVDHSVDFTLSLTGGTDSPVTTTTTFSCTSVLQKVVAQATNTGVAPGGHTTATVSCRGTQDVASQTGSADYSYVQLYKEPFESIREESVVATTVVVNAENLTYSSVAYGNGTMCFWFWAERDDTEVPLFSWDSTADFQVGYTITGAIDVDVTGSGTEKVTSSTTVAEQTWAHLCVAWVDGTSLLLYINGAEVSYATAGDGWTAGGAFGTTLAIGQAPGASIQGGVVISRAKMWIGRTLRAGQVQRQYNQERTDYGL